MRFVNGWTKAGDIEVGINTDAFGIQVYHNAFNEGPIPIRAMFTSSFTFMTRWAKFKAKMRAISEIVKA